MLSNFKDKTIYQIYPKSFLDSNGDGWGDIQGVIQKLDYLELLGIDCIWFNPMYISPQKDNGYDVTDYRSIDPRFGTMEDFEMLVKCAQEHHIDIMFDMVFNHTSTTHEWFQKALNNDPYYKDFYIFKKGKDKNTPPNNWQSKFGGKAWEYVESLDEWYLHLFDVSQADLNWENENVRKECSDIVNFWLNKGVKGFRFDVINLISKNGYEDDPNHFDGRQYYTDGNHVHEYIKELNMNSFGKDPDCITVGEMSSTSIDNCIRYSGAEENELNMVFTFHHLKTDYKDNNKWKLKEFDFKELKDLLIKWQIGLQEANAWNALFLNNHDQPRSLSRFGDDKNYPIESAKMLATTMHMMRGTPYVYMGEEIGMTNAYFNDIDDYVDVESINMYDILQKEGHSKEEVLKILNHRSRDNARTPMQWNQKENAGFTNGKPWIKVNKNYRVVNVENALKNQDSIFYHYKALIAMRKQYEVIQDGVFIPLLKDHDSVFAYKRKLDHEELIVVSNFYGLETSIELDDIVGCEVLLSNYKDTKIDKAMTLRPYESVVLYKQFK